MLPLEFRYRSDTVALAIECLIKAIEARTMDTGIPEYKIPAGVDRSDLPRYQRERQAVQRKMEAVRVAAVHHDMTQGFVLTQYFYDQLLQFEKDPASLQDSIGEMVYGMDIDQQVHRARQTEFDEQADEDVLSTQQATQARGSGPGRGEARRGRVSGTSQCPGAPGACSARTTHCRRWPTTPAPTSSWRGAAHDRARRRGHQPFPDHFGHDQGTATAGVVAHLPGSHARPGMQTRPGAYRNTSWRWRTRDGQQDTRLAAERGIKSAYAVKGHGCEEDDADDEPGPKPTRTWSASKVRLRSRSDRASCGDARTVERRRLIMKWPGRRPGVGPGFRQEQNEPIEGCVKAVLSDLEAALGYGFADPQLLLRALTHRSLATSRP